MKIMTHFWKVLGKGRVLARLRVWDAMLCNVDAQTSKLCFSKGSEKKLIGPHEKDKK